MEQVDKLKALVTSIFSILTSLLGTLALPVILLVGCNILDYITAILAGPNRGQKIESRLGIQGIKKKVSMWLLIVVAAIVDSLIKYAGETVGIMLPFHFLIAAIVAIWLICNEILSILENINDAGIKTPIFLRKIIVYMKTQVEEKTELKEHETDENQKK